LHGLVRVCVTANNSVLVDVVVYFLGLLEAMEQQQVSIAKAGVVASLPARCSVIAAANPKHGSYNMNKTVAENLSMSKPILSRFDLVFILRDRADKALDQRVSSNIVNLYRNSNAKHEIKVEAYNNNSSNVGSTSGRYSGEKRMPLAERLDWVNDFQKQPLPASLVRDYIAYAREYCKPKLTPEAASVLKDYFMELRYAQVRSWAWHSCLS
jgi:DNA helicase MCM8